jgi:CheY-like chemotaxis protein
MLPSQTHLPVQPAPLLRAPSTRRLRPSVLVVDDSPSVRLSVVQILTPNGYTVVEAEDGVLGLALLRAAPAPVVMLVDLVMPRLDGVQVLQAVAAEPRLAARHAYILLTAGDQLVTPALVGLLRRLAVGVVWKPCAPSTLVTAVAEATLRLPWA